jgi:hypothetical protein
MSPYIAFFYTLFGFTGVDTNCKNSLVKAEKEEKKPDILWKFQDKIFF